MSDERDDLIDKLRSGSLLNHERAAIADILETDAKVEDIIYIIMTQHWDMAACPCWICKAGRELGLHPTSDFLDNEHGKVWVDMPDSPFKITISLKK